MDDAASAFVTVAEAQRSGLWHVVDNEPVVAADYLRYFAKRLGAAGAAARAGVAGADAGGLGGGGFHDRLDADIE